MAEVTNEELSKQLNDLHERLTKGDIEVTVTYPKDPMDQFDSVKDPAKKENPETFKVSEFKNALIKNQPRVVTDDMLPYNFVTRFAEMYEELQKEPWTEYLEAMGLDGFAAAHEKFYEKNADWKDWLYSAIAGLFIPMVGGVIALLFISNFTNLQRMIQGALFNLASIISRGRIPRGLILALNEGQTIPRPQNRAVVEAREQARTAGLAGLGNVPDPTTLEPLRLKLVELNGQIGPFNAEVRKLPSARSITKTAGAIEKLKNAINGINNNKIKKVADAINKFDSTNMPDVGKIQKLNKAVGKSDPDKIRDLAKSIGKLVGAAQRFQPGELPDPGQMRTAARAARDLARAGGEVRSAFNDLRTAARRTEQAI
ncbi:hypothetical protein [Streptomyces sp. NPDC053431]|uniref:hypothetical protein n=1 Tax=Streptomyces sp. NPDC053431 TaxID=3365703 RepID=UPI0037D184AF